MVLPIVLPLIISNAKVMKTRILHVNSADIGKILYPVDNSFIYNITDNRVDNEIKLAGYNYNPPRKAYPVKIVSGNYTRTTNSYRGEVHLFDAVTVEYEGKLYSISNAFTIEPE